MLWCGYWSETVSRGKRDRQRVLLLHDLVRLLHVLGTLGIVAS
jgi:hypothetical protein